MSVVNRMLYSLRLRAVKTDDMPPLLKRLFVITQLRDDDNNLRWWKIIIPMVLLSSAVIYTTVFKAYKEEPIEHNMGIKTLAVLKKQETLEILLPDTKNEKKHDVVVEQDIVIDDPIDQDRNEILDHAMQRALDHKLPDESILEQPTVISSEPHSPMMQTPVNERMHTEDTTGHGVTVPQNEFLSHLPALPHRLLDQSHHDDAYVKLHGLGAPLDFVAETVSTDVSQAIEPDVSAEMISEAKVVENSQTGRKHVKIVAPEKKEKPLIKKKEPPIKKPQLSATVVTIARKKIIKKPLPLTAEEQSIAAYTNAVDDLVKGKLAGAEQSLYLALKHDNNNRQARETLAGILINHRRLSEAQQVLQQGMQAAPDYFPYRQWLARIHLENNEPAKALPVLNQGSDHFQDNADYLALLAIIYQQLGRYSDAIEFFQKAIELRPKESRWWLAMGLAYETENNWESAKNSYVEAINTHQLQSDASKYVYERLALVSNKQ